MKKYPIYYIEWRDHFASNGTWTDIKWIEDDSPAEYMCKSIGFLIKNEKYFITIAQNLNDKDQCSDLMNILKESIVRKKRLTI